MNTKIKATNMDLSDLISAFIDEKLLSVGKVIDTSDEGLLCEVEIGKSSNHHNSGDIYRAEINITTPGHTYRTVADKDELKNAIVKAFDEIIVSIKHVKGKEETLKRRAGASIKKRLKGLKNI